MIQDPKMVWAAMYAASMGTAADATDLNVQLAIRRANRAVASLREHGVFGEAGWTPVTGDNVTVRTVEITGPIGPCGIEAEATGERERARVVARLERFCREAPTDPIGFACHFAVAVQDIRSGKGE